MSIEKKSLLSTLHSTERATELSAPAAKHAAVRAMKFVKASKLVKTTKQVKAAKAVKM
jgi:hypothetical protein